MKSRSSDKLSVTLVYEETQIDDLGQFKLGQFKVE